MGMPAAWTQRRYAMVVTNSLASVPSWAPIGRDPLWYRHHLGQATGAAGEPLAEVLAHHRERWDHLRDYDDFAQLARFEPDAAEQWAQLAVDAGATLSFSSAKHHDGWCWWEAPATDRLVPSPSPSGLLRAHAAACERHGLAFGAVYSTLDWAETTTGTPAHVLDVVAPQVTSLLTVERPQVLWLCGARSPRDHELLAAVAVSSDEVAVFSDAPLPGALHVRSEMPHRIEHSPWAMCGGIGATAGYNRIEPVGGRLTAHDLIARYTEALAKGGGLLVAVGPDATGSISDDQTRPLRDAGRWIHDHAPLLDRCVPWQAWGDADTRLLADPDDPSILYAVDLTGAGHFPVLSPNLVEVRDGAPATPGDDLAPPRLTQDPTRGLVIDSGHRIAPVVWRLTIAPPIRPAELFAPRADESVDISDLLLHAQPGEIVQLGEGLHHGRVCVPDRVTLRGLGPGRTTLRIGGNAIEVGRGSRLEHLTVAPADDDRPAPATLVVLVGERSRLLGCSVNGSVEVRADDGAVRGTRLCGVVAKGADRLSLTHSTLIGGAGDLAVRLLGGGEHLVDSCEIDGHDGGILATDTTGTRVRGCNISTRRFGVRLRHTEDGRVRGNQFHRTGRAVDVQAGRQARIEGNAVFGGDSGCVVQQGAADAHVSGNHWERCRVGLFAWDAVVAEAHDNTAVDLLDPEGAFVSGP